MSEFRGPSEQNPYTTQKLTSEETPTQTPTVAESLTPTAEQIPPVMESDWVRHLKKTITEAPVNRQRVEKPLSDFDKRNNEILAQRNAAVDHQIEKKPLTINGVPIQISHANISAAELVLIDINRCEALIQKTHNKLKEAERPKSVLEKMVSYITKKGIDPINRQETIKAQERLIEELQQLKGSFFDSFGIKDPSLRNGHTFAELLHYQSDMQIFKSAVFTELVRESKTKKE